MVLDEIWLTPCKASPVSFSSFWPLGPVFFRFWGFGNFSRVNFYEKIFFTDPRRPILRKNFFRKIFWMISEMKSPDIAAKKFC